MELSEESIVQDLVHQKLKESVHRSVQRYVNVCPNDGEAKILAVLSPTKLDVIANNIFKGLVFPDNLMEPERQSSLDQLTLFFVLQEAIPSSFYKKRNREKKPNSLLKSALQLSSYNSSEDAQQPPYNQPPNAIDECDTACVTAMSDSAENS